MVDFKKRLHSSGPEKRINPIEIYETLDRQSDKGPLRPHQFTILSDWFENFRSRRDVILKLHTGQGKTIIGLLILQSRLNQGSGPALYLCPNAFLVDQTRIQAESFGIKYTLWDGSLSDDFVEGKTILIATANTLFNGITKFGLGAKSAPVGTILMDDSHSCIDALKDSCRIKLKKDHLCYQQIRDLFSPELQKQGAGTLADILNGSFEALLAVPYWDWEDKHLEVVSILSKHADAREIKFAWPLIRDNIKNCRCIISGAGLEISPYLSPFELFGSYYKASHRVFMSATVNDDSFFINGLGLETETITSPLCIKHEKWSGEKMVLIPSLIDGSLDRTEVVNILARPGKKRTYGVVAIVPSFADAEDWEKYGSVVAKRDTIIEDVENLKNGDRDKALVIANRYDGIDLPDAICRVLVLCGLPYGESLEDRYFESCRSNSEIISMKVAQTIEQGLGRSVRGEKDYSAIVITGTDVVRIIKSKKTQTFFSNQTRTQIDIGLEISEFAKEDIKAGMEPSKAFVSLITQLLTRDPGWKEFYTDKMNEMPEDADKKRVLAIFEAERKANLKYIAGDCSGAVAIIQKLMDGNITDEEDKGWYLQEMARMMYGQSKTKSKELQVVAHGKNKYLFKPQGGVEIKKLSATGIRRTENIIDYLKLNVSFEELRLNVESVLSLLRFGVNSDKFEKAVDDLGKMLGFRTQRPDKEFNEGPDNLWTLRDNEYFFIECKNKVDLTRATINKAETGQFNNACAWFKRIHGDVKVSRVMIIPTKKVSSATGFNETANIMRQSNLNRLVRNVDLFFGEFRLLDFKDLTPDHIQKLLDNHNLSVNAIVDDYCEPAVQLNN